VNTPFGGEYLQIMPDRGIVFDSDSGLDQLVGVVAGLKRRTA